MGTEGALVLANCPHVASLEQLEIEGNTAIGDEGIVALASSPYLANLKKLNFPEAPAHLRKRFSKVLR
jgi:hypothetical protein